MKHLTAAWQRLASSVLIETSSPLPYDRYRINERLVVKDGSGYHPDADIERAREKQQASYDKWRTTNPGRPRPDRYKPERASSWTAHHYFTADTATPGTVAFLDCEVQGNYVKIAYGEVRADQRGKGLMRQLISALYERHPKATISWGKLMSPEMGTLHRSFQQSHPEQTGTASVYY